MNFEGGSATRAALRTPTPWIVLAVSLAMSFWAGEAAWRSQRPS